MTTAPRFDLDPPAHGTPNPAPAPATMALVAVGGFLIGGPFGLAVAVLALAVWWHRPDWLGALAVGLLLASALGSVLGAWPGPDSLRQSFADDRPWGGAAGLGAGVALLVAVARAAGADRAPTATIAPPASKSAPLGTRIGPWLPVGAIALGAALVSLALAPDALTAGGRLAAEALRAGDGFGREPGAHHPPLTLVVAAVFPSAPGTLQAVLAGATAAATIILGSRLAGRRTGLIAGALAGALPLVWDQRLSGALAGLLVLTALLLAAPDRITTARAATAGAVLVAAALARPEALLVLPVVVAWLAVWPGPRPDAGVRLVTVLGVALVGMWLAATALHGQTGTWWPAIREPSLVIEGNLGLLAVLLTGAATLLAFDEVRWRWATHDLSVTRHLPWLALPGLALAVLVVAPVWHRDLSFAVGPLVAVGAAASLTRRLGAGSRSPKAQPAKAGS